jgi:hypothetical protein
VTRVVPLEAYDKFFPGAQELREGYQYYEQYTYFGPEHEKRTTAANALVPAAPRYSRCRASALERVRKWIPLLTPHEREQLRNELTQ